MASEAINLLNSTFRRVIDMSDDSTSDARLLVTVSHVAASNGKDLDAPFPLLTTAIV